MVRLVTRIATASATACLGVVGYAATANAATANAATANAATANAATANAATTNAATANTRASTCGTAWVRVWGLLGERCYTGNGVITVNLKGVHREQIVGRHTVCLSTAPVVLTVCAIGPRTINITRPVRVTRIAIKTP
jgi:hypothetical protein